MAPRAHIDRVDTLHCSEKGGVIRSLVNKARVVDLTDTTFSVLWSALQAAGIPQVPSNVLNPDGTPAVGFEALVLVDREAQLFDNDPGTCDVTLTYETLLDNQELKFPLGIATDGPGNQGNFILYGKHKSSVQQKAINQFIDWSQENQGPPPLKNIIVGCKYAAGDTLFQDPTKLIVQGGEIQAFTPQDNFQCEGYLNTNNPRAVKNLVHNKTNSRFWQDGGPYEWLCTEVHFQIVGVARVNGQPIHRYRFAFEFQHNPDTWNPTVVFTDRRTGFPPGIEDPPGSGIMRSLLQDGVGFKSVQYLRAIDYNTAFNAFFEGFANLGD